MQVSAPILDWTGRVSACEYDDGKGWTCEMRAKKPSPMKNDSRWRGASRVPGEYARHENTTCIRVYVICDYLYKCICILLGVDYL